MIDASAFKAFSSMVAVAALRVLLERAWSLFEFVT